MSGSWSDLMFGDARADVVSLIGWTVCVDVKSRRVVSFSINSVILSIRFCISIIVLTILLWVVIELTIESPISLNCLFVSFFSDVSSLECVAWQVVTWSSWIPMLVSLVSISSSRLNCLSIVDIRSVVTFAEESSTCCCFLRIASNSWMRAWYVALEALVIDCVDPMLWSSKSLERRPEVDSEVWAC